MHIYLVQLVMIAHLVWIRIGIGHISFYSNWLQFIYLKAGGILRHGPMPAKPATPKESEIWASIWKSLFTFWTGLSNFPHWAVVHFGTGIRGSSLLNTKSVEYPSFAALAVDSPPTKQLPVVNTVKFSSRNNPTAAGLICTRTDRLFVNSKSFTVGSFSPFFSY